MRCYRQSAQNLFKQQKFISWNERSSTGAVTRYTEQSLTNGSHFLPKNLERERGKRGNTSAAPICVRDPPKSLPLFGWLGLSPLHLGTRAAGRSKGEPRYHVGQWPNTSFALPTERRA
ncbi:hypothetical protein E2C01_028647 [Portunus trituberculatus]|uniref:Uncharacterized protein n=1 Tax=Portunus trituberculatus TaxID=210409 RepID=A0A5B7EQ13_PORTR|nr:hypothetical protein [Portunus trituberculatus]